MHLSPIHVKSSSACSKGGIGNRLCDVVGTGLMRENFPANLLSILTPAWHLGDGTKIEIRTAYGEQQYLYVAGHRQVSLLSYKNEKGMTFYTKILYCFLVSCQELFER